MNMLNKLIQRLFTPRQKEIEIHRASNRVAVSIDRYKNMSKEIQDEIERNRFARYLVYDKGEGSHVKHGAH
ncbi:hypothetical protein B9D94_19620 [Paenibacillus sp. Cedars]|nr:hypothetical protein B9D94_19620 [Paenibacillus sp. Cedars]